MSEDGRVPSGRCGEKIRAWVKIARLQFYPMTWIAYSMGAAVVFCTRQKFSLPAYLAGYLVLFFIELSTILTNEYYDYPTDRLNQNAGPFTGGTRVLVEGKLGFQEVRTGIFLSLGLVVSSAILLVQVSRDVSPFAILVLVLLGLFLGLGYTCPPLKFSYRGLAEVTVGLTHSPYVILCGYLFQGGAVNDSLPWLISIPLFFAVLAAITLAGIPDRRADQEVSKRVFAVLWGAREAAILAAFFACVAVISGVMLWYARIIQGNPAIIIFAGIPHCLLLLAFLFKLIRSDHYDREINGIMALALSYIIWFGLIPLISFLGC